MDLNIFNNGLLASQGAIIATAGLLLAFFAAIKAFHERSKLSHIPTIGPSGILSSYIGALRFRHHSQEMIQEGYKKYGGQPFRVPTMYRWLIFVGKPEHIDDMRQASEEVMSFRRRCNPVQVDTTVGRYIHPERYHIGTLRNRLTRNIGPRFDDIVDELFTAFAEVIPMKGNGEWTTVPVLRSTAKIIGRTSNRVFVDLPLCRDQGYLALLDQFVIDLIQTSMFLNNFPRVLIPFIALFQTKVMNCVDKTMKYLGPTIEECLRHEKSEGKDWPGKPASANDLIGWLLDQAKGTQRTAREITARVLITNTAAIHTTSTTFTHVMYDLIAHPGYLKGLREEVETIISEEGWTKASVDKMHKVDSFIKESQRLAGLTSTGMDRKVLRDFTFSDGTFIPGGSYLSFPVWHIHRDEKYYVDPYKFDGFRFANLRALPDGGFKYQLVSLSDEFIAFGNGRSACPGRFFAAYEMKLMLAYIVLNYDVKLAKGGPRPENNWRANWIIPPNAEVLFRKRTT